VDTTLSQAQRMGAPRAIALCQCFNGALEYQAGNWDVAEESLNDSIRLYRELGAASGEALAWQRLGVLQTARGHLEDGLRSLEEGIQVAERAVMRAHCLARLYASLTRNRLLADDLETADAYLSLGLEMSQRHGNCATCNALLLPAAVSLRIAQGKMMQAEQYCEELDAAAEKYGSKMWVAMAKQARGEFLAHMERVEEAIAEYEQASKAYRSAGHDYEAARCLEAAAALYAVRNEPEDGRRAVETRKIAEALLERLVT
jgi:predicted negative regulator of RcsB-dependent stress response